MQITLETSAANLVQSVSAGEITINETTYRSHVVLTREKLVEDWKVEEAADLGREDFSWLAEFEPELIILGTGKRQVFPSPDVMQPLIESQIGIEVMTTVNACHTYNVLAHEGRKVLAALINE